MKRRTVAAQLTVFASISVLILAYTLIVLLRYDPTDTPFTVTVHLKSSGGLYSGAEVAYRGVQVGKVDTVTLRTDDVVAVLKIEEGKKVPDTAVAHVYDLSAVGEQYLDLTPAKPSKTFLRDGSEIPQSRTTVPVETATVIFDMERFINSIDPADVQTIGREGQLAFQNTGPQLTSLLANARTIIDQLSLSEDGLINVLRNGATLLRGAASHVGDFASFTASLRQVTSTLAARTPDITALLKQAVPTARIVNSLIDSNGSAITTLLANTATLTDIQAVRVPGLRSLLVAVPEFARLAPTIVHNGKLSVVADLNQNQGICNTGLPLTDPVSGKKTALHKARCGSAIVRGAVNSPHPSGGASPDSLSAQPLGGSARSVSPTMQVGTYDPSSGLVSSSDGTLVRLGTTGGQRRLLGDNAWQAMLLAGTGG